MTENRSEKNEAGKNKEFLYLGAAAIGVYIIAKVGNDIVQTIRHNQRDDIEVTTDESETQ